MTTFLLLSPLRKPYFRLFHQNIYIEYQLIAKQEIFKKYFSEWTHYFIFFYYLCKMDTYKAKLQGRTV